MKLDSILEGQEYKVLNGDIDVEITGINYDSRKIQPGDLFVAIKGFATDGHKYIDKALENGAKAILVEDQYIQESNAVIVQMEDTRKALALASAVFFDNPSLKFRLIGVTGTNGKTSTTNLLKTIFRASGKKTGLFGTIENTIDEEVLPASHTTPESRDLQEMFAILASKKADYCVMEVSSHALSLKRVEGSEYDVAVFTNLTQDHLDFHKNMEEYLEAKKILFTMLNRPGKKSGYKYAVLNSDDPASKKIAKEVTVPIIWYGIDKKADYRAVDINIGLKGATFTLEYQRGKIPLKLQLTGKFSIYNCLAAVAVAIEEGISPVLIRKALEETRVVGRFEPVHCGQDFAVVIDYAHTPDSLENVLKTAREITKNRVITVFGCGGDRDATKRPIMGEIGVKYSDYAIITSDNPRTEDPAKIVENVEAGAKKVPEGKYEVLVDRRAAIVKAIEMAETGDVILIAGKGHEDYQIIGQTKYPFSDFTVAKEALECRLEK